jgi:alpha-D-xyloside xylohydrolase
MEQIYPGVWKLTLGVPEAATPVSLRHVAPAAQALAGLPQAVQSPIDATEIVGRKTRRGYTVRLPLGENEQVYGLGLQLLSFNQRKAKKMVRVNSDPQADLGDSHAPVPFYVSTAGYGVLVDTARYATFYFGPVLPRPEPSAMAEAKKVLGQSTPPQEFYTWVTQNRKGPVLVDIPAADGVDVYIFAGPGLREAVQRYNLFSGGGCLPPRWGLGVWYRLMYTFDQQQALEAAESMRRDETPCDVIGLEPGWQSHAYSCSFTWNKTFPEPSQFVRRLADQHYRVNLWTHAFVHPSSPIYEAIYPYSGDYEVLGGLVPDLVSSQGRQIMADLFAHEHVDLGVSGYKLDECDNSDYNSVHYLYPELSTFPSGVDGEVMHSRMGIEFQEMVESIYRGRGLRTYGDVRSSHALAAPYPFVLYSDLYKHKDFIRGLVNCGFSGLLWTPEVRDAASEEDLIRRLQSVVLSPQALINAWYITNPPWKQWRTAENNAGQFVDNLQELTAACRKILELRMALLPYLYAAFYRYHLEGLPPFRALVMDYPEDANTWGIDDQFMVGDRLLAAPLVAGEAGREVYLPEGQWYDFWTGAPHAGGVKIKLTVPLDIIPIFVKGGAVLPLAHPTLHTDDPASFDLTVRIYGDGALACTLFEDDGLTLGYQNGQFNCLTLAWDNQQGCGTELRSGDFAGTRQGHADHFRVIEWKRF